jgi:hypothetical protein
LIGDHQFYTLWMRQFFGERGDQRIPGGSVFGSKRMSHPPDDGQLVTEHDIHVSAGVQMFRFWERNAVTAHRPRCMLGAIEALRPLPVAADRRLRDCGQSLRFGVSAR